MFYSYILAIYVLKINIIGSADFLVTDHQTHIQTPILFIYWYNGRLAPKLLVISDLICWHRISTITWQTYYSSLCLTHGLCTQILQLNHNIQLCSVCTRGKSCIDLKGFTADRYRLSARNVTSQSKGSRPFKSIYRVSYNYPLPRLNF